MSFVGVAPELLATAATDLGRIGSAISAAHSAAAPPTTGIVPAAADKVSVATAALFEAHARSFLALGARATAWHEQFVQALSAAGGSYVNTEVANAEQFLGAHLTGGRDAAGGLFGHNSAAGGASDSVRPSAAPYPSTSTTWLDVATGTVTNLTALTQFVLSNPAPILHQFITNQVGYLNTLGAAAQGLAVATVHELGQLPPTLHTALGYLASGDVVDGIGTLWGYVSRFGENIAVASLATLLPALSIPAEMVTHLGNLVSVNTLLDLSSLLSNVPYYPLNASIAAFATTAQDVLTAAQSGDVVTVLGDLAHFPATITNAFINGFPDPAWEKLTGTDPAIALLTNPTTGPGFGSVYNILLAREVIAGALGA